MQRKEGIDLATIVGILVGVGSLIGAIILEFNHLNPDFGSQFLQMSALLIIFGGTLGATMLSFPMREVVKIPALMAVAFSEKEYDVAGFVGYVHGLAEKARREGILSLEQNAQAGDQNDWFLALGLRLAVDGAEPQVVIDMLESEVDSMGSRHRVGQDVFNSLGGYAPTMGIVGTVVGLIAALATAGKGDADPSAIVGAIATAFIATFYGIGSANLFFLPIAGKLKMKSQDEQFFKHVQIEAIKSIQAGENPRVVHDKLAILFKRGTVPEAAK